MFDGAIRWPERTSFRPVGREVIDEIRRAIVEARMACREPYAVPIPKATKDELAKGLTYEEESLAMIAPTVCGLEMVPISALPERAHFAVLSR